jgi:hypothetical protein
MRGIQLPALGNSPCLHKGGKAMQVIYERCCGIDVHKKVLVACLITMGTNDQRRKDIQTFGTMTQDLLSLLDWRNRCQLYACRTDQYWCVTSNRFLTRF